MRVSPLAIIGSILTLSSLPASAAPPGASTFEITRELDRPADRREVRKTRTFSISYIGPDSAKVRRQKVVVAGEPAITSADLEPGVKAELERVTTGAEGARWLSTVDTTQKGGGIVPVLRVRFTPEGRRKFTELTRGWEDRRLAVIIDGKVVATPLVRRTANTSELSIAGFFDQEESVALAASVNGLPAVGERSQTKGKVTRLYRAAPAAR